MMRRMPWGVFGGRIFELLGPSHRDFLHLGRKGVEEGEKKGRIRGKNTWITKKKGRIGRKLVE